MKHSKKKGKIMADQRIEVNFIRLYFIPDDHVILGGLHSTQSICHFNDLHYRKIRSHFYN